MEELAKVVGSLVVDVGALKGFELERQYRKRPFAYFSDLVKRARLLSDEEVRDLLEGAVEEGLLSEREAKEVGGVDLIIKGRLKETGEEVYLVVEVSWTIGKEDVSRAKERAEFLSKLGLKTLPVVAGREMGRGVEEVARSSEVCWVVDGKLGWRLSALS